MTNRNVALALCAATLAVAVALVILAAGHMAQVHGLLLVKAGLLAAVVFSFRLVELAGSDSMSLWGAARSYSGELE